MNTTVVWSLLLSIDGLRDRIIDGLRDRILLVKDGQHTNQRSNGLSLNDLGQSLNVELKPNS